jgi:hypothetical protein
VSAARSGSTGRVTLSVGGSTLKYTASAALMSDAAPAAAFVCPICDFTEPIAHHGRGFALVGAARLRFAAERDVEGRRAVRVDVVSAVISTVSPTFVPVPCASTSSMVSGVTPAMRYAAWSAFFCPAALGA